MQQTASRSGESDMTASDAESWAKLRLVEGESAASKWELVSSLGHTTLTVGSNSDCTWVVRGDGVRPIHFSLHWDGSTLRVADVYSAGDVRVDGTALSSQWRPLQGTARIEFGTAVLQVETSAPTEAHAAEHPLETPRGGDVKTRSSSPVRGTGKETLIGVAPQTVAGLQAALDGQHAGASKSDSPGKPGSERAPRSNNSPSMKATLVGGIGLTPTPMGGSPRGSVKPNATLMGFASADALRGALGTQAPGQGGGASLGDGDQRTVQGFPAHGKHGSSAPPSSSPAGRRMTQKGVVSQPPGVMQGAVAQAPVRAVSERPGGRLEGRDEQGRIGSAWQERADADSLRAARTLRGVQEPDDESSGARRAPRTGPPSEWDMGERSGADRMSDIPTQMRDPTTFESRRPRRGFPWQYVGVALLTTVAYFAWLYLLDHM